MSKGMHNLIALTNVANKYHSKIILHVGVNEITKHVCFTDDTDCLPCEITHYRLAEFVNDDDIMNKAKLIEKQGYIMTINTMSLFYETEQE